MIKPVITNDVKELKVLVSKYYRLLKNEKVKNAGLELELSYFKKPIPLKVYKSC